MVAGLAACGALGASPAAQDIQADSACGCRRADSDLITVVQDDGAGCSSSGCSRSGSLSGSLDAQPHAWRQQPLRDDQRPASRSPPLPPTTPEWQQHVVRGAAAAAAWMAALSPPETPRAPGAAADRAAVARAGLRQPLLPTCANDSRSETHE
jgi:hypothetical protein